MVLFDVGFGSNHLAFKALLVFVLSISLWTETGFAHPDVEQGREYYDQAEFQRAVASFDRAQRSRSLSFKELTSLLEGRALAHQALGDQRSARADFEALLSIAPDFELDDSTPPSRRKMFAEIKREQEDPLSLVVLAEDVPDGVRLEAEVRRDPARLVQRVEIHYREGGGRWRVEEGSRLNIAADEEVEYYGEAIGPGGTVLATDGSEDNPRVYEKRRLSTDPIDNEAPKRRSSSKNTGLYIGIGVGVAAVVALVIILVAGGSTSTQPSIPMLVN